MKILRACIAASMAMALAGVSVSPAMAQEKSGIKEGFTIPAGSGKTVVIFRPAVKVGAQSTGGMFEPNLEWTDQAKLHLGREIISQQAGLGLKIVDMPEVVGEDAALLAEYQGLFSAVASSVMQYQFFPGNRLPTKKKGAFEWTLGPDVKRLGEISGADYGLFIWTEDQYGSTGRKVAQLFAAGLLGVAIQSGVHAGYAGLVDLRTGELLWLNADGQMGGDVRDAEGAKKRVSQLLANFPGSAPTLPASAAKR